MKTLLMYLSGGFLGALALILSAKLGKVLLRWNPRSTTYADSEDDND